MMDEMAGHAAQIEEHCIRYNIFIGIVTSLSPKGTSAKLFCI
jgi:hypothetical protein